MFLAPRSLGLRLWHWLDAGVILGLLGTVLLRSTLFSPRTNATRIHDKIEAAGGAVTLDQARAAARTLNDHLWTWHVYLGYALAGLALLRVAVFLVDRGRAARAPSSPSSASLHYRVVKATHRLFYAAMGLMVVTGLMITFQRQLPLGKAVMKAAHTVHEGVYWYVIAFVVLHVAGVVRSELREDPGLISGMIHGKGGPG